MGVKSHTQPQRLCLCVCTLVCVCVCVRAQVHYILDEMLLTGCIYDTNKQNILEPIQLLEQAAAL